METFFYGNHFANFQDSPHCVQSLIFVSGSLICFLGYLVDNVHFGHKIDSESYFPLLINILTHLMSFLFLLPVFAVSHIRIFSSSANPEKISMYSSDINEAESKISPIIFFYCLWSFLFGFFRNDFYFIKPSFDPHWFYLYLSAIFSFCFRFWISVYPWIVILLFIGSFALFLPLSYAT